MIIYKITNKLNGMCYIGQTTQSLKKRWLRHNNSSYCVVLHRAIQKYGKHAFTIEEIASYNTLEDLNNAEEYYIAWFNCLAPDGYNLLKGGLNKKHNEQTKVKMSRSAKGKIISIETRKKMSLSATGRLMSKEAKIKVSKLHKGKPKSEEHKAKISNSLKERNL